MEEMIDTVRKKYFFYLNCNYPAARHIFKRWMEWRPPEKAWLAYIAFETRMGEVEN